LKDSEHSAFNEKSHELTSFFNEKFGSTHIPSHNLEHHIRVWVYAESIVAQLRNNGFTISNDFLAGLQAACLTHDIGLVVEKGEAHGKAGRDMVAGFLPQSEVPVSMHEEILNAVENHDRKEYPGISTPDSMLTILSVADDLDAFGYIGIYRYIEIYLERGILAENIGPAVTVNLTGRYNHMSRVYGFLPEFIKHHTRRYEITRDFFNSEGPFSQPGRLTVIDIINEELLKNKQGITEISGRYRTSAYNDVAHFFRALHTELLTAEYV
jgi:HD superfamily phosphodiesterase